ncbi:MAG TPA: stage V sporulation protein AA [Bacillus sp. (in: firmicutes)]|uniref:stage V sporulation protein AA n=1 Tax=Bacillus litorisediminis TaxID=2922713 RepID=UPI001FADD2D2|nr:stage V sporulation protein AA [Bacillus litorisediminis]HWO75805.1 stage V sporulation protein AA [Bacillus sp. (in: firmicutes)]
MENSIYIRLRHRLQVRPNERVIVGDVAQVIAPEELLEQIKKLVVYQVKREDNNIVIIDVMQVIKKILQEFPQIDVQAIGPTQTIVEIIFRKKRVSKILFILVWFLLFVGAALTIMNFHEDVSMQIVQQKIYTMITGEEVEKPLLFQIPYSFGLGLGMILFFNHVFKKRINEEPSPLEVEMFNYQQDLDRYISLKENKESMKNIDDD